MTDSPKKLAKLLPTLGNILAATVFVGVVFHAFLTVWGSTFVGHFTLLRLWDDVVLLILLLMVSYWIASDRKLRQLLFKNWLFRLIIIYVFSTIIFGVFAFITDKVELKALAYGLLVNTRFMLWSMAVWVVSLQSTWLRSSWRRLIFWPFLVTCAFAILQFFVLPNDFLTHFGYVKNSTYDPYITINQNTSTIRVQSFLRGANPLGAYLVMATGLIAACSIESRRRVKYTLFGLIALLALLLTFSRSGWLGSIVVLISVLWLSLRKPRPKAIFFSAVFILVLIPIVGLALLHNNKGVQNAVFHVSANSTAQQTSNAGHAQALKSSIHDIAEQPFGRGPGTAGQASWYNQPHEVRNSESYFLEIGQEMGLLGLILFAAILLITGKELSKRNSDPLARGLLAGMIGLLIVNALTYGWVDDTLGFVYWGLVGVALSKKEPILAEQLD